ncbi:LOW QUALITY PROTEIN: hypothetical protein SETIT_3G408600v2 [Setaria italica]|uniref:non-specific serine/threonine protein kinase n=1 Tax=Setaria italica TaxID=4555 RepID=A0A368QR38_SETIT|nr:LOW QUALITY PROTEIN: hypothetical protein SETIT_3G408600v2 [Setaria italica]
MAPPPDLLSRLILLLSLAVAAAARIVPVQYLYPPFNLTYFHFIDTNGAFLLSPGSNFSAAVYNAGATEASDSQSRFFFSVLHTAPAPRSGPPPPPAPPPRYVVLSLSATGLRLFDPSAAQLDPAWSTPRLREPVAALRLLDTGELALIDARNATLWSSLDRPTDTLIHGQPLRLGTPLTSSASDQDLSPGAYRLVLTPNDALLQWATSSSSASPAFLTYWALSSDPAAVQDSSHAVASMAVNASGIYLLAENGRGTVYRLLFPSPPPAASSKGIILKVDPSGRLRALTLAAGAAVATVWAAPANDCDLPLPCPSLSLCTAGGNGSTCMCPDALSTYSNGGCAPADGSSLPAAIPPDSSCDAGKAVKKVSYVSLGAGIGYLPTKFAQADASGDALPACRDLCSANCSCLGFFYRNSSRSCFLLHGRIGSVFRAGADAAAGFIKTLPPPPPASSRRSLSLITIVFGIVFPTVAAVLMSLLLYAMGAQCLRRRRPQHLKKSTSSWFKLPAMLSLSRAASSAPSASEDLGDDEDVLIPGLPTRFTYGELDAATDGFKWQIGCGGFGSVFRGELPDRSTVAVKRMNGLGAGQGRREFLTEIAVIGNVHHVNLVKLRGFCAEGARQLLVYEFMNRGSLDQTLFRRSGNSTAALEWPARLHVCVGAARGLAYLHGGCDRKILHCDVKPENILLDDRGGVKIADFGLAKLMSPEQSGLFTTMRGTRGYLAPEWLMNAPITDKADVYSFGMVLLEIVRGRKNSKKQPEEEEEHATTGSSGGASSEHTTSGYFPAVAVELHEQGRHAELLDPRLEGRADVAQWSGWCGWRSAASTRTRRCGRPWAIVSAMLDGSMDAAEPRPGSPPLPQDVRARPRRPAARRRRVDGQGL